MKVFQMDSRWIECRQRDLMEFRVGHNYLMMRVKTRENALPANLNSDIPACITIETHPKVTFLLIRLVTSLPAVGHGKKMEGSVTRDLGGKSMQVLQENLLETTRI